jgi:4-amino-4-deoxy-L-arabinose transferase-like glycosyltransferase
VRRLTDRTPLRWKGWSINSHPVYNPGVRFAAWLLVALSALTLFAGLGRPAITDSDEAFYAEAGREMVTGGDWLTPHFNYQNRFQKPILFYWVVSLCYTAAGISEGAARFGSALAGVGLVLLALAAGRRWYDERTGFLAGTIAATSFGCISAARLSLPDLPLAFFISLTIWAAFVALFDRHRRARRWWLTAAAAAALGFLTKGPLALAVPLLVVAVPFALERGWRRVRAVDLALAAALFVVAAAPWYAAMTAEHGAAYLRGFFIGDNLERFATTAFNAHRPVYFYLPIVLGGMLPWSPFFALTASPIARAIRQRRLPARPDVRIWWWLLAPLLLFTASVGKQPRYILPMVVPLAVLLATAIRRATATLPLPPEQRPGRPEHHPVTPGDAQPGLFRWMAALSGVTIVVLALLLWRARPLLYALPPGRLALGAGALAAGGIAVLLVAASRQWRAVPAAIVASAVVFVLVSRYVLYAVPDLDPVEQMAGRVLTHRGAGERVGSYRMFVRNLVFYTHVKQEDLYGDESLAAFLDTPDRVLCVLPARELRRLEEISRQPGADRRTLVFRQVRRLESITYFDASTAKASTLVSPDLERDLQTAVLISNR